MTDVRWRRSLYVRLAAIVFAFIAALLAAQAGLLLWATEGLSSGGAAQSARQLSVLVASDVAAALRVDPSVDLQRRLHEQFGGSLQDILVVLSDGQSYSNHEDLSLELLKAGQRAIADIHKVEKPVDRDEMRGETRDEARDKVRDKARDETRHGSRDDGPVEVTPITVAGTPIGCVVVLSQAPPFSRVLRRFGPTMALVAGGVLLVGAGIIAFVVFGPAHRRLTAVQTAAERVGAGDLRVRVPERGGDEVAALARAFNQMAQALESSDSLRRQLLADISHELKTPLTSIRGYLDTLLATDIALDAAMRERYLSIVSREGRRLERIVGELLDLARLEAGGVPLHREPVSLDELFDLVAERHERELAARGIRLTRHIGAGADEVSGDADRLEQVILNLAANALRHVPDGGVLALSADVVDDASIRLTVHDSGPGIPPEHLPRVFDRFYKIDASRTAADGSGLGLSLVKAIVEYHGGTVSARNDNGAVIEILLPRLSARDGI